jgi:hypothetical protein
MAPRRGGVGGDGTAPRVARVEGDEGERRGRGRAQGCGEGRAPAATTGEERVGIWGEKQRREEAESGDLGG